MTGIMMSTAAHSQTRFKIDQDRIAHILRDQWLNVPIYQRSYSWTSEEVTEYWDDLTSAMINDDPDYFLGTVVVTPDQDADRLSVIDGQQRLATTTMILAAIRNAYLTAGLQERAMIVETRYLATGELDREDLLPKLMLNSEDDYFFQNTVVLPPSKAVAVSKAYPSHKRIEGAFDLIQAKVDSVVANSGSAWQPALAKWVQFLENSVQIVLVKAPNESDAFMIFETLNDRGLDLTIADLLKNYLFRLAGSSHIDAVKRRWIAVTTVLDTGSNPKILTSFLRQHWSSKYGLVRDRDLYREMRKMIQDRTQALAYASEIEKESRNYAALLNSDHEFWSDFGTGTREDIETLLRLDLEQYRPLLLAAMSHFPVAEIQRLIRSLIAWSVRGLIVGGLGGGTPEKAYVEAGTRIRTGAITDTAGVFGVLAPSIATDIDFQNFFATARVTKPSLSRYYLLALERFKMGEDEPELVPNANEAEVNLEHVYPRNATASDWPAFNPIDSNTWLWRLGNLALMKKTKNSRIGNKSFSVKAPILATSSLELTNEIAAEPDWTPQTIESRQQALAVMAPQVWKRIP